MTNNQSVRLCDPAETRTSDGWIDPRIKASFWKAEAAMVSMSSIGRIALGTPHAADVAYEDVITDIDKETVRSIVGFENSL